MKARITLLGIGVLLLAAVSSGCNSAEKKPAEDPAPQQLAEEVQKYSAEPTISLYRQATGATEELALEDYITGVVAGEIGDTFPQEALKAQAIVARTMTLTLLEYEGGTQEKHGTDASDDHTEFQAYDETAITDRIRQAVQDTRGQILTYDGKFLYTEFHSVSGGMTAAIAEAFPKLAEKAYYLVPVPTNGIDYAPEKYRDWTVRINRWEVAQAMGLAGELYQLTVSQTGPSGRALELSANDGESLMHAAEFRQAVGFDRLFSTNFSAVRLEDDAVVFQGSGWGHGAGMEQWGAYAMAETGSSATQIVNHYYPDAQLIQLYP